MSITGAPLSGENAHKPSPQFIVSVNVGLRHTIALSSTQLLFGWGMVNLTNATTADLPTTSSHSQPPCDRSVSTDLTPATHTTPPPRRRFSVFCDASSTSELYLAPTQVIYGRGVPNPFSEGKFLALRGCSSSSLGYVTIDAEVPTVVGLSQASVASAPRLVKPSSASKIATTTASDGLSGKAKLQATANTVRRALLFSPPKTASAKKSDGDSISEATMDDKLMVTGRPKPLFNPFLKDYNMKTDAEVCVHDFPLALVFFADLIFCLFSRNLSRTNFAML